MQNLEYEAAYRPEGATHVSRKTGSFYKNGPVVWHVWASLPGMPNAPKRWVKTNRLLGGYGIQDLKLEPLPLPSVNGVLKGTVEGFREVYRDPGASSNAQKIKDHYRSLPEWGRLTPQVSEALDSLAEIAARLIRDDLK